MSDQGKDQTTPSEKPVSLAEAEKAAGKKIAIAPVRYLLIFSLLSFLLGLFLPHAGNVKGYDVLFSTATAANGSVKVGETVFVVLGTLAAIVFNSLLLITRRTVVAAITYLLAGMALLTSLFGLWMRKQSNEIYGLPGIGSGFYLEVFSIVVLVFALSCVVFARSPEQKRIAAQRAVTEELDEVGYAQRAALVSKQHNDPDTNPLFIDDRRQRAAAHRKQKPNTGDTSQ